MAGIIVGGIVLAAGLFAWLWVMGGLDMIAAFDRALRERRAERIAAAARREIAERNDHRSE